MWLDSLLSVTGRSVRNSPQPWPEIESELGTELPADYKRLCEAFGVGEFSGNVWVLCADDTLATDFLTLWRGMLEGDCEGYELFPPYRVHVPGTTGGLIPWATTSMADLYFWQVTEGSADGWPVVALIKDGEGPHRYEMTATEFLYRVLTDPGFRPFTWASYVPEPSFEEG